MNCDHPYEDLVRSSYIFQVFHVYVDVHGKGVKYILPMNKGKVIVCPIPWHMLPCSLVLLKTINEYGWVHQIGLIMFQSMLERLLNIGQNFHLNQKLNFIRDFGHVLNFIGFLNDSFLPLNMIW
jgi:hypothetical protein